MTVERNATWLRRVYPHNPLYLISAAIALYGIGVALRDAPAERYALITPMIGGYVVLMVLAGWLVVRVGKVWEDARTLLLTVLLVFAALSTVYDKLCLDDATAGGRQLAIAFVFCCVTVEAALAALRIRLPLAYRAPFYLQLGVLFAFPSPLGRYSIDGDDPAMCLGVVGFSAAAGASLLALLPAVVTRGLHREDNGTPWPWPYYPWSIFVFMAAAMAVRSWLLSVSFSPSGGVDPAFLPYFLSPIVLATAVLLIEIGLRHHARGAQATGAVMLGAVIPLSFSGAELNEAQELTVRLLEARFGGPAFLATVVVAAIALYAALRRSAMAEPVLLGAVAMAGAVAPDTRTFGELSTPAAWSLGAIAIWLATTGAWSRQLWRLVATPFPLLLIAGQQPSLSWLLENNGLGAAAVGVLWILSVPLLCTDAWARQWRRAAPAWFAAVAPVVAIASPPWWELPDWAGVAAPATLGAFTIAYWQYERLRWHLLSTVWSLAVALGSAATVGLRGLADLQLQRGLAAYAIGCLLLMVGLLVSLCKAGIVTRVVDWLFEIDRTGEESEPA